MTAMLASAIGIHAIAASLVLTPGSLGAQLTALADSNPQELVLTGAATSSDLSLLRNMPSSVTSLDMSSLEIEDNSLPPFALFSTAVISVKLPSMLKSIGEAAFAESAVTSVNFPSTLTSIGARAFYRCVGLTAVDLSSTEVRSIPEQCFYGSSALKTVKFPAYIAEIGKSAFMKSGVSEINLPAVNAIHDYAFAEIPWLTSVTLRDGVSLGEGAFYGDGTLGYVAGLQSGNAALVFAESGSRDGVITVNGETVEDGAYASVKTACIKFMPDVKRIKDHAFRNMTGLREVDVSLLGKNVPLCSENAFSGLDASEITLSVNGGDADAWRSAPVWKDFKIIDNISSLNGKVSEDTDITVTRNGDNIIIRALRIIKEVRIWTASGEELWESNPMTTECSVPSLPAEVLILRIACEGTVKTIKIIK